MSSSATSKLHVIRRSGVGEPAATLIRSRLEHARAAGLLLSYDGAFLYDGDEVTVMFSPENMHPSQRANFSCERAIADLLVERAIAQYAPTIPPDRE